MQDPGQAFARVGAIAAAPVPRHTQLRQYSFGARSTHVTNFGSSTLFYLTFSARNATIAIPRAIRQAINQAIGA